MSTPAHLPLGRDDLPPDHPRRIARIAYLPEHTLKHEPPEVQRRCAEHRQKEAARHAAWTALSKS